jgi:hypothetical protein
LHFVGLGQGALGHWLWDGSRWQSEPPLGLTLAPQQESPVELLAAAINKQGKMIVVLAKRTGEGDVAENTLLYSTRTLKLPPKQTAIEEVPTQTLLPPTLASATLTPEHSSTPVSTVNTEPTNSQGAADREETNDPISPFTMAILPVALLLLSVLGLMLRRATRDKDR